MEQIVSKQLTKENNKNRRDGKGRVIALSRNVYRLLNKNTFYVESETSDKRYYFVRFNPSVFEWCSCKDFESNRSERCKHLYGVEYAIRFATVKEVDKLPEEVHIKKDTQNLVSKHVKNESIKATNEETTEALDYRTQRLSYEDDSYSF